MPELKEEIRNASKEQLILMLYEGAIKFAEEAKECMKAQDKEGTHDKITRAQNIILGLKYTLDMKAGGAIAENLSSLYKYVYHRWVEANIHQSTERVEEGLGIIRGVRDAWKVALDKLKEIQHANHEVQNPQGQIHFQITEEEY